MCGPIADESTETVSDKRKRARNAVKLQQQYVLTLRADLKQQEKELAQLRKDRDAI
jgi:hypothetical protein